MDDDFRELEAELRRLRPIGPSQHLMVALEDGLRDERPVAREPRRIWVALPIAAALAALLALAPTLRRDRAALADSGANRDFPAAAFTPVSARNLLLSARDEGYVTLADGTLAHQVRRSFVDTITWKNSATRASLVWTVPREEIRATPVTFQ